MNGYRLLIALALALTSLPAAAVETLVVGGEDNGATRTVAAGSVVEVRLTGTMTAGLRWINRSGRDGPRLAATDLEPLIEGDEVSQEALTEIFYFETTEPGEAVIVLHHLRSWEADPIGTYTLTLIVE